MTDSLNETKKTARVFIVFLTIGIVLAIYSGYGEFDWPGVFISAGIVGFGYVLSQHKAIKASGRYLVVEFLITTAVWSMFTGIFYYTGTLFR